MRQKSVILDFQEQTKDRVAALKHTVKTVTRVAEQATRASMKVAKNCTKEINRLEKLLPKPAKRKKKAVKKETAAPAPASQAAVVSKFVPKRLELQSSSKPRSKVVGSYGLGKIPPKPADVQAPDTDGTE